MPKPIVEDFVAIRAGMQQLIPSQIQILKVNEQINEQIMWLYREVIFGAFRVPAHLIPAGESYGRSPTDFLPEEPV